MATTANITLSGLQTIDGVTVAAGNRVLVKDQTTASENGIYDVSTGNWTRAKDFDGSRDIVQYTRVIVGAGTVNAGREYQVSTSSPSIGSSLSFALSGPYSGSLAAQVAAEASATAAAASEANADADAIATAADRVQTGLDRVAAAASEANAEVYAALIGTSEAYRNCIYHSPDAFGIAHYICDTSSGTVRVRSILYDDGSEQDLTATARGDSIDRDRPRPGIYASPDYEGVEVQFIGTDGNVWGFGYEDGSVKPLGGSLNPVADPDTTVGAYIDAGALKVVGDDGIATVAASGVKAVQEVPTRDGKFKIVSAPTEGGARVTLADLGTWYGAQSSRIPGMPAVGTKLYHIITIGNSLSAGSDGAPVSGSDTVFDNYATELEPTCYVMTNSSKSIVDIRGGCYRGNGSTAEKIREAELTGLAAYRAKAGSGTVHGMTPIDGFVDFVTDAKDAFGVAPKFLLSSCGLGGAEIETWKRTPSANIDPSTGVDAAETPWTLRSEFDAMVNAAKTLATAQGWGYEVLCVLYKGGEQDHADSGFAADLEQVIDEINADLTTLGATCYTGQQYYPIWFSSQSGSNGSDVAAGAYNGTYAVNGILALHDSGDLHCACPDYAVIAHSGYTGSAPDYIHMAATGYAIVAAYVWRNLVRKMIGAAAIDPLRIASAVRSGTTITVTYEGGEGNPIAFDTSLISERSGTDYGFRWLVGGVAQSITATITGDREIQITIPSGVAGDLEYAQYGHLNAATAFVEAEQPRGNVRETVGFSTSIPGIATLYDWAVSEKWSVA